MTVREAGPRSYAKVLRVRCVHFILVLVSSVLMRILTAGQACLQHYTQPSAEPLPATSSALRGTILPLGLVALTHNTASASGVGGRREANGRSAQTTICLKCACAPLHGISSSHDLTGCRRPKNRFYDTAADDAQHPAPNTCTMSYLCPHPQPPTARSTAQPRQCITHSHSFTSRIHSTAATASFCPQVGRLGKKPESTCTSQTVRVPRHGTRRKYARALS